MDALRDEFLSEEDLDLRNMDDDEIEAYWNAWLLQAQITNDADADTYSHGVFVQCRVKNASGAVATAANKQYHTETRSLGLRAGHDRNKLGQLDDELSDMDDLGNPGSR